ncbi:MAG: two-component sensor histidine kinase [Azospira oryzae]|jgi:two-component system phosphate regulon sensor histidine kinase PhoR|nr:two-component sensor histidine kinase [Cytophaga sp.]PZR34606.1 MAG: two-component sensor histidine kinase [Azospira oryzae]
MVYSARTMALLLAGTIAVVTSLFLSLVQSVSQYAIIVAGIISFSASYLFIFVVLEFLVFREINKIYKMMEKLRKKELSGIRKQQSGALNPLKDINEEIYSFATLKQKEIDELKKLEAFRKEFVADVSHELKTPLFAAQGFVHTLLDGAMNDKNVRTKFLKKAAKSLDGLDVLVQDLLTLSQIETGDIKMHFDHIDLHKLCLEVIDQFEEKAETKNIKLKLDNSHPHHKLIVFADWQRITQVVTNLVSNAINYTPEGGEVNVHFEVSKKNVVTVVKDTGEGIPPQHLTRIFERFYRVDKSRSREKGGTGLGLAIVKHILEGHGSRPEVESEVGKGSSFSFKLSKAKEGHDHGD